MPKGYINNALGDVEINPEVIAQYAGAQAVECFGVVGMAARSMRDGVMKRLKRDSISKGVNIEITDNRLTIHFHIIVAYGLNVLAISQNLVENVKYKLEAFSGMEVEKIHVVVEGVRVID